MTHPSPWALQSWKHISDSPLAAAWESAMPCQPPFALVGGYEVREHGLAWLIGQQTATGWRVVSVVAKRRKPVVRCGEVKWE